MQTNLSDREARPSQRNVAGGDVTLRMHRLDGDALQRAAEAGDRHPQRRLSSVPLPDAGSDESAPHAKPDESGKVARVPAIDTVKLNKLIVSPYKLVGFAVLFVILVGLASYIATHVFFYVNASWVEPMVLSPTDPKVLQINSQLAQESAHRAAIAGQELELEARLHDAERIAASAQEFEDDFRLAMSGDLEERRGQLSRFGALLSRYHATMGEIAQDNSAFADVSKGRIAEEYRAPSSTATRWSRASTSSPRSRAPI